MADIPWLRLPLVAASEHGRRWLVYQHNLQLADNTVMAYGRALEDLLRFCSRSEAECDSATRADIASYVRDLTERPNPRGANVRVLDSGAGLSNATIQQRLTAVRLYYDYLVEERVREDNPVGRGHYTPGKGFGGKRERGLVPRFKKLPRTLTSEEWLAVVEAVREEPIRNRTMFVLAYDCALRREELCSLQVGDIDHGLRLLRVRGETTQNRRERSLPYSEAAASLLAAYMPCRRNLLRAPGPLFLSASRRNRAHPISVWTWTKVVEGIAERANVRALTTHTLRHQRLTDLALAGWDIHEIATFAGHLSTDTTMDYIHLSGRDLARKLAAGMAELQAERLRNMRETLL